MDTRNYIKRQNKVRNVRRARIVTWRERLESARASWHARQAKRAERAEAAEENDAPRFPWVKLLGALAVLACVTQLVYAAGIFEQYSVRTQHFHVA